MLFGVDPDDNIKGNPYLTESFQGTLEACSPASQFDVITSMVAEHITDPHRVVAKLAELAKPGGLVIVYTPNKRAPMSVVAALLPFRLHQPLKNLLWGTEPPDTFPTVYRLNTRRDLLSAFLEGRVRRSLVQETRRLPHFQSLPPAQLSGANPPARLPPHGPALPGNLLARRLP